MNYENLINLCKNRKNQKKIKNYYFNYKNNIDLHKDDNKLFKIIIKLENIELFDFFYKQTKYKNFVFKIDEKKLDIYDSESLLCYLCRYNYLDFVKYICENEINLDLYDKYNEPLILSCQENNLDIVKYLYKYYKNLDIFNDEVILTYSIFKRNYDISVWYLDVLFKSNVDKILKKQQLDYVLEHICTVDSKIFEKLLKKYEIKETDKVLEKCLFNNDSKNIKLYLLNNYSFSNVVIEECYYCILKIKDLDIIKKLDKLYNYSESISWNSLFMVSLSNNNIILCNYIYKNHLMSNINELLKIFNMSLNVFCEIISYYKKIKCDGLDYMINIINDKYEINDEIKLKMIQNLCNSNKLLEAKLIYSKLKCKNLYLKKIKENQILYSCNLKTIKWILEIYNLKLDNLHITNDLLYNIIYIIRYKNINKKESLKLIRFLMYKKNMIKKYEIDDFISLNNIFIMKLLTKHKDFKTKETLFNICKYCDIEILKWYLTYSCIYNENNLYICLKLCCKNGNYDIFMYLINNYDLNNIISKNIYELFVRSCESNNLKIILVLETYIKSKLKIENADNLIKSNSFNLVRYLLDSSKLEINKNSLLKYSLKNGNLDVVKLLLLKLDEIDIKKIIHLYDGCLLKKILNNNYFEIVKLLDKYININVLENIVNKKLLNDLLNNEYIEMLKYINLKIELKSKINNNMFKNCCKLKLKLSIRFLCEINENYDYIIKNDEIIAIIKNSIEYYYEKKNYKKLIEIFKIKTAENHFDINECYICYENNGLLRTECNHNFCLDCIFKWYIHTKKECPYCRTILKLYKSKLLIL